VLTQRHTTFLSQPQPTSCHIPEHSLLSRSQLS